MTLRRPASPSLADRYPFLAGGGVTGELMRAVDWARTPVGPVDHWPMSLRTTVATVLHSRHPMFLWWGPELIQFYNDAYLPSFGIGKHPAAMGQCGKECWPEIWSIIAPQIEDVMQRGKASWNENHLVPIFRNGRIEEVYWTYGYSPVYDDSGNIGGTLVVCTETTTRVLAERRLSVSHALSERLATIRKSSGLWRAVIDVLQTASNDVPFALCYVLDPHTNVLKLEEACGLSPQELETLKPIVLDRLADLHGLHGVCNAPDANAWHAERVKLTAEQEAFIVPLRSSSNTSACSVIAFGLNQRLPFDAVYREHLEQLARSVTLAIMRIEASQSREALERDRNNLLLQAPVAAALFVGPEHTFELANRLYCQVVGRGDLVGKTYREAFPELVNTDLPGVLDRVYQTGEPFVTSELCVPLDLRGQGLEDRFFKFTLEPVRDGTQAVYGMMAIAVDITEQVMARRTLEHAHSEREKLLTELEAASRAKDEFLAMLGHELRNPLSPIVTALLLMKLRDDGRTTREREIIERQVTHLVRLVDDLLDVSKIARGKIELRREKVELTEVLAQAIEIASGLIEQRSHKLAVNVAADDLTWVGDPVRLAQVIANLLTNAARYTDPGGNIEVHVSRTADEFTLSVSDNGIGIAPEMLPRIFDVFVQGRRSADRAEGGLGIGLTLVKTLVRMHGGTATAHSAGLGKGSQFVIHLPTPERLLSDCPITDKETLQEPSFAPRRVLLVDDNVDAADLLGEVLRTSGYVVHVAHDPVSALDVAPSFAPAVAILDIGLPGMDGYELGARLRSRLAPRPCRLIAVTGYGQEHDRSRSQASGFERHLVKPVDVNVLLRIVAAQDEGVPLQT